MNIRTDVSQLADWSTRRVSVLTCRQETGFLVCAVTSRVARLLSVCDLIWCTLGNVGKLVTVLRWLTMLTHTHCHLNFFLLFVYRHLLVWKCVFVFPCDRRLTDNMMPFDSGVQLKSSELCHCHPKIKNIHSSHLHHG